MINRRLHVAMVIPPWVGFCRSALVVAARCREPEEHDYLRGVVEPLLVGEVEWLGEVDGSRKRELLSQARCLLFRRVEECFDAQPMAESYERLYRAIAPADVAPARNGGDRSTVKVVLVSRRVQDWSAWGRPPAWTFRVAAPRTFPVPRS